MKKNNPLISIIIPNYNNSKTIIETLDSVTNQVYQNFEIIIIDDGSTDESVKIISEYINLNSNYTIKLFTQDNQGPSIARNLGSSHALGKYLLFLDSDDKIATTYISKCIALLEEKSNLNIVYSEAAFFEGKSGKWELPEFNINSFLIMNCIPIFAVIRKNVFEDVGKFDTNLTFTEDWELWMRIIKKYNGVYRIPEILYHYRKKNDQSSLTDNQNINANSEKSRLYIYNKHYDLYKKHNLGIETIITSHNDNLYYKKKYYNQWFKKIFYNLKKDK